MNFKERLTHWWQANSWPVKWFFLTRVGLFLLAYLGLVLLPVVSGEGFWRAFPDNLFLDGWSRWDSGWYIDIAQNGYSDELQNIYLNTAFFPLYPLVIKVLTYLTSNYSLSGILISNLTLLISSILLFQLVKEKFEVETAEKSVLFLLLNPFSFFFSAVYTESLFLFAVLMAFIFAHKKRWLAASLCCAAAGATRLVGILTLLPIFYLYFESIEFKWRKIKPDIFWLSLGLVGMAGFMLFLGLKFGDPFLFAKSQNAPGWKEGVGLFSALDALRMAGSWSALKTGGFPLIYVVHVLSFFVALSVLIVTRRKMPAAWWLWALATMLISFSVWISMGRFLIVIFPLYVAVSQLFKGKQFDALLYVSTMLLSLFTLMFTHWYWVG